MDTWVVASSTAEGIVLGWSGSVNQDDAVDTADAADVNGIVPDGSDGIIAPENDAIPLDSGPAAQKKKHPAEVELENSSDFGKLPSYQQQALRDYVYKEDPDEATAVERAKKVTSLSFTIADVNQVNTTVGDVFIDKLQNYPDVLPDIESLAQRSFFKKLVVGVDGAAVVATGPALVTAQRQLLQVVSQLSYVAKSTTNLQRQQLLCNTLEAILGNGDLTLGLFDNNEPLIGGYCWVPPGEVPRVSLNTNRYSNGITETEIDNSYAAAMLGILTHEVNHAIRAKTIGDTAEEHFMDEVYAYITGFIGEKLELTDQRIGWMFNVLGGRETAKKKDFRPDVYNLREVVDGEFGQKFINELRYRNGKLQLPLPSHGLPGESWNLNNVFSS